VENPTDQLNLWRSDFGRAYTDRNDFENPARIAAWKRVIAGLAVDRVVEVGCNVGWNLTYLSRLGVSELYAVEPQRYAVERARVRSPQYNVFQGTAFELPFRDGWCDLAFTSGVLIHIAPDDVPRAIDEMYRVSRRYCVAIEYDAPTEQQINYRGNANALWKRDHGAIWQARHPDLRLVRRFELGAADGYDDCTAHVFEKPQAGSAA
jgi:pseudaminic acid biosynthesis-associated methylase